jgi:hypothetical protein
VREQSGARQRARQVAALLGARNDASRGESARAFCARGASMRGAHSWPREERLPSSVGMVALSWFESMRLRGGAQACESRRA